MDVVVETTKGDIIDIELNNTFNKNIINRNCVYFMNLGSSYALSKDNKEIKNIYQINLNFNKSNKLREIYLLKEKYDNSVYTNSFSIININIPMYKKKYYEKNLKGEKEHIYLAMLGCNDKELDKLSKKDKLVREVRNQVYIFNEDGTLTINRTREDEIELEKKFIYSDGKETGRIEGKKEELVSVVKNMLQSGLSNKEIRKYTNISLKELNEIKKEIK